MNRPKVIKAIEMLQESSKKQLEAYNQLVQSVPSMIDTEVKEVVKTVPKPDIGIPHLVLEVFDEYGENNFKHIVAAGQHLCKQFASNKMGE